MSQFRRRAMMAMQSQSVLPAGCKECEYLENSGGQYIDTGVKLNFSKHRIIAKLGYLAGNISFGARISATNESFYYLQNGQNHMFGRWYNYEYTAGTQSVGDIIDIDYSKDYRLSTCDGVIKHFNEIQITATNTGTYNCYLFTYNQSGTAVSSAALSRVYNWELYENNNLIQHLIPCLDTNSVPCFYDTVSKTFFYNQGTGTFKYKTKAKYRECEYLESTGTQYIALPKIDYTNQTIYSKANFTNTKDSRIFGITTGTTERIELGLGWEGLYYSYGFGFGAKAGDQVIKTGVYREFVFGFKADKYLYVDSIKSSINEFYLGDESGFNKFTEDKSIVLFGTNRDGRNILSSVGIASFKIYDEIGEVVNLIPVLDSYGVPCMYDKVTDTFSYNQGTGNFLYKLKE